MRGISKTATYFRVQVFVACKPKPRTREKHFPLTSEPSWLLAQRATMEAELRNEIERLNPAKATAVRGTLAADAARYLEEVKSTLTIETYKSRVSELNASLAVLGTMPRHAIRNHHIERMVEQWKVPTEREPVVVNGVTYKPRPWSYPSPKTIQNRKRSLEHLYRHFDGEKCRTPFDDVKTLPKVKKVRPRATSLSIIKRVVDNLCAQEKNGRLRTAKLRARFLVMVTCGQRPVQIRKTGPDDVRLDEQPPMWYVPDAKDGNPIPLPLNNDMQAAWRLFISANAWGKWDSRSAARVLRRAGWPENVRPYNARHTVGITLDLEGVDIGDISTFIGHKHVETTRTFYAPGEAAKLRAASQKLDGRINLDPTQALYLGTPLEQRRNGAKRAEMVRAAAGS